MKDLLLNTLLLIVAIVLISTIGVIGFFVELFFTAILLWHKQASKHIRTVAVSLDQTGNAMAWLLLTLLFVGRNAREYVEFWNEDETVSSVIGKNKRMGSLSAIWKCLDLVLEYLDPWHSENSIEHDE